MNVDDGELARIRQAMVRQVNEIASLHAELTEARAEIERMKRDGYAPQGKILCDAEPVAWDVYVADADNGYLIETLDDPQYIDDATNHNAEITPLFAAPTASPQSPGAAMPGADGSTVATPDGGAPK